MNICFFEGNMANIGGTEKMTQLLANKLCESDNNIFVLSKSNPKGKPSFDLDSRINYSNLDNSKYIKIYSPVKDIFLLSRFIKKNNIDILVNVDVSLGLFSLPLKILRPKLKQVFWEHFCVLYNINSKRTNKLRKSALKHGDAYVLLTPQDEEELKKQNSNAKIINIPNICTYQVSDTPYNQDSKTILSVGNLISVKGFDLAINAAAKIFAKHPDWSWHIYGRGSEEEKLKQKVKDLSLQNNVKFMGRAADLASVYKEAAIFVLPSRSEGFGLVLIEAQSHHLPTVAFNVPFGPRNIINDRVNGYLIDPFDIDKMSNAVCSLIENDDLRKSFSQNATNDLYKYQADKVAEQWLELLREIC